MYLKEIRTYGFKSFADRTVIELCKNLNGIVGPNGSGKSNVVDAVRWVLGEQSLKSLRGDTSTDIIFSGSKSRKPLNSASVTLVFDNSNRHLPIDYNEVAIKRMAFRSGENEYYINNSKCRLKDITDLLIDSGTAKESYNIISQGKIDEILSTKSTDRRVIFEEAAGVLKYKKRKEEAIRKLDRTNSNLNRINDIISELETNINPLKEQADSANIYLEAKDKLANIEVALITSDITSMNTEYKEIKEKIEKLDDEISNLSSNLGSYDIDILKEKDKLKNINNELQQKQNEYLEANKSHEKIDADLRILKERIKYASNDKNTENILNLKENELKMDTSINEIKNEINLLEKKKELISKKIDENNSKYESIKNNLNNSNSSLLKLNREETDLKYRIDYLENVINTNSSLPKSVQNILNNPKFSGIHNVIGKLFEVDNKYATAISISLGASSSYVVVDDTNVAKTLVNYLKENNIGRATFFPLNVITPRYVDNDTLKKINSNPSFVGTADKLVKYDSRYSNIILNQLGNVLVVKDIDTANQISKIINHRFKIVTLDGQVANVGGSITGGNNYSNSNIIKEKYELDNNKHLLELNLSKKKEAILSVSKINNDLNDTENNLYIDKRELNELVDIINLKKNNILSLTDDKNKILNELKDLEKIGSNSTNEEEEKLLKSLYEIKEQIANLATEIAKLKLDKEKIETNISDLEDTSKSSNSFIGKKEKELNNLNIRLNRLDVMLDNLLLTLTDEYNLTFEKAKNNYKLEIDEKEARATVTELKDKIKDIGLVNLGAPSEYERVSSRYNFLIKQKDDLNNAENTLLEIINEMDNTMETKFVETFEKIRKEFKVVFKELFKGGSAELVLTDPDNILETGIDIIAEPPGKRLQNISLLSGGEKTFTAISLLFAILNIREVPFCLFDEVEAALDDANVESFGNYLKKYKDQTQFILITHKKKTMEYVDVLYGMTMQESGVSKLVSVKLEDLRKKV